MATATITVMFTDLVGSTELLSRVGEAQADELRREHFGLLRTTMAKHSGREVKNLGDGLMVVFDGVASALDAAVAMQQAITARPSEAEPLSIKIGVAVGDAEVDDDDYFGLPVVEAARLCAKAQADEILTTEFVRMLARSRSEVELEPVGALQLKGLDEPLETYRVRWAPIDPSERRPPLPPRLASAVSTNFVGRGAEDEQLVAAWKAVTHGERRVMLLCGEPGIGKTTLSARFAGERYDEGAAVVYGRCDEDLGIPYQPWIEALTQLVRHGPDPVLAAHVADRGGHLARLVPELARRLSVEVPVGSDADTDRFVLFGCAVDLLARASSQYPVLLVLDDLHWADRGSVQLLRHVAACDETMRVGILGTFRDSDVTSNDPLSDFLAALHRESRGVRIPLVGFDDDDLLHLMETVAGHEMDEQGVALRDALLAETAGNPFFVVEILRHLAETGAIYQQDARWVTNSDLRDVGLPVSVREVVGRRLAGLGPDTERVLRLGAVIGRDFDVPLLTAVAQVDEDALIDLCDAAVDAAILQTTDDPDRYTFAHALVEHTLYDGLSPARRTRAHKAVAEHLESLAGPDGGTRVGELAYHWAQAVQPGDATKAVHYARIAGDRALEQLAPDEALRWYAQALDLTDRMLAPDRRLRAELLIGLGEAERQAGVAAHREHLLEAAELADAIDAVDLLARAVLANSRGWATLGQSDPERIAMIGRALGKVRDDADRARLLSLFALERIYETELDERLAIAQEAITAARGSDDLYALYLALAQATFSTLAPSTLGQRIQWLDEACSIANRLGDPVARHVAYDRRMLAALEEGDIARVRECDSVGRRSLVGIPYDPGHWSNAFHAVWQTALLGDLGAAENLAEAALQIGLQDDHPDAFSMYGAQLVNIRLHQGRLDEIVALIEQAVDDMPALQVYRAVLAQTYARTGETVRALQLLEGALASGFAMRVDGSWTTTLACWADVASVAGHGDASRALRDLQAPYHAQIVATPISVLPAVAFYLGQLDRVLGNLDTADAWFTEAMEIHRRMESPLLVAYSEAAWAGLLADRGEGDDHDRARAMAEQALAAATPGAYGYIEHDARAVLARLQ